MTNIVAYRGHQNPVWDADWSPMGIYFATASRDRTARLWSTDRVNALRIYAGHLSDVDVSKFVERNPYSDVTSSVSAFTPTRCILPRHPVITQPAYGMYKREHLFVSL